MNSLILFIPTYNRSDSLRTVLENYLPTICKLKDYFSIDIVVSDNCSSDNTLNILKSLKVKYSFLVINRMPINSGFKGQVKFLFDNFSGQYKYLWIHGDDDFVEPRLLYSIILLVLSSNDAIFYLPVGPKSISYLPGLNIFDPLEISKIIRRIKFQFQFITSWISPFNSYINHYTFAIESGLENFDPHIYTHLSLVATYTTYIFQAPVITLLPGVPTLHIGSDDTKSSLSRIVDIYWKRFELNWSLFEKHNSLHSTPQLDFSFYLRSDLQLFRSIYSILLSNQFINTSHVYQIKGQYRIYFFYCISYFMVLFKPFFTPVIKTYSFSKNFFRNA